MPQGVYGSLDATDIPVSVRLKFADAVNACTVAGECWIWPKSTASHGYGQIGWGAKDGPRGLVLAHRLSYAVFVGRIPEGMTVDHLCRERRCFNPAHLRLLSNVENARDNGASRRTHCPQGHAYDEANTHYDRNGHRKCRACQKARRAVA